MKLKKTSDSVDLNEKQEDIYKQLADMCVDEEGNFKIKIICKGPRKEDSGHHLSLNIYSDIYIFCERLSLDYPTRFKSPSEAARAFLYFASHVFKNLFPSKKLDFIYDTHLRSEPHIDAVQKVDAALLYIRSLEQMKNHLLEDGSWDGDEAEEYINGLEPRIRDAVRKNLEQEEYHKAHPYHKTRAIDKAKTKWNIND